MFRKILNIRGISIHELSKHLEVSIPTANTYASQPDRMRTHHRKALAKWKRLGLNQTIVDAICNGDITEDDIGLTIGGKEVKTKPQQP